jgi:uncharacterized protein (TIGR03663 family)
MMDRAIDMSRVNLEVVAYIVVIALSLLAHLWGLGNMAMHHDESIHAWMSWKFYTGQGDFSCAGGGTSDTYCYDPIYHGPSLYILTLFSYFLFGDGDAQARLPMALAGVGLVASCWMLRPYLGRRGALVAAVLLGFSPSLLYFTRFARHDGLMVLWELWMVIGMLRYLDTGKAGYLYLLAASLALAIGTHELYYILLFIFGILVAMRLVAESSFARYLNWVMGTILVLSGIFILINPPLPVGEGLYLGEKMFLVAATLLFTWLASRVWSPEPVLIPRLVALWREQRTTLWIALSILVGLYLVMYTTFFAYPRGAIDGLYTGLAYWLGSQQEYARGDQPWYYYFMQLAIYEPLGIVCGIGAALYLFTRPATRALQRARQSRTGDDTPEASSNGQEYTGETIPLPEGKRKRRRKHQGDQPATSDEPAQVPAEQPATTPVAPAARLPGALSDVPTGNLFALLVLVWYLSAIIIFSWAGEKMPWLTVHMSLPGNLVAAWAVAMLLRQLPPLRRTASTDAEQGASASPGWRLLLVPLVLIIMMVAFGVAWARLFSEAQGQVGQSNLLQGVIPLIIFGGLLYVMLTLWGVLGGRVVLALAGLTVASVLGVYMIRASWLAVYTHPDVPVELLVYTQTSPDVPRYVDYLEELAINQTRNYRTEEDVAGGLTMPVILSSGEHSLAWPMQWYLRDFQRTSWKDSGELSNPTRETFEVDLPDGTRGLAPAVLLARPHVTPDVRAVLEEYYVRPYGESGVFNWWFPEGDKCSPDSPGYKRFYFNWMTSQEQVRDDPPKGCGASAGDTLVAEGGLPAPWAPFIWPFLPDNLDHITQYMLFRELPEPLTPGSRDMEVWLRSDLVSGASGGTAASTGSAGGALRLLAQQAFGESTEMLAPTGLAVDSRGTVYVADTLNHRVLVFGEDGSLERTIGSLGSGRGEFNEPRGLAVDADDNLYVADTWNARIVKLDPDGEWLQSWGSGDEDMGNGRVATMIDDSPEAREENPLGFFGPRGVAVDADGQVYISDTGNRRIIVTDDEGDYLYQWGSPGSAPGDFNEPTGLGVDAAGRIYVADTWNSRVQVFETDDEGMVAPLPVATWRVSGWEPNTYNDPSLGVSADGEVYVSVPARGQVFAATTLGSALLRWGGTGDDLASLNSPSGVAVGPAGDVYVVDRDTGRVLRFTLPEVLPTP